MHLLESRLRAGQFVPKVCNLIVQLQGFCPYLVTLGPQTPSLGLKMAPQVVVASDRISLLLHNRLKRLGNNLPNNEFGKSRCV